MAGGLIGAIFIHLGRAIGAGLLGSVIGTALMVAAYMPARMVIEHGRLEPTIGAAPVLFGFSLFFTVPSAVLLAAPIIWPFRVWSVRHPWRAAFCYAVIGGLAGVAVIAILTSGYVPVMPVAALYGASTGAAFIAVLNWTNPRLLPESAWD